MTDALVVLVTMPDGTQAADMARTLVQEQLVACVNILPGVQSIYSFKGELCQDAEVLCVMKTRAELFERLRQRVKELHPYEVPEVVALSVDRGDEPYLNWIRQVTTDPG